MTDARVAVLGLGRSGVSAAKAAAFAGARPFVVDEHESESTAANKALLAKLGIPSWDSWHGSLTKENADIVVVSPGVPSDHPLLREAERTGSEVIGEIELAYRVAKAPIVAITGTNGKSTTTVMTYLCAKSAGLEPILCGNIFGSGFDEVPLAEAAVLADSSQVLIAEVSSFQLERTSNFRPVSAGITNIWPDHLDRYGGSLAAYAAAKQRIFLAQTEEDYAVIRALDPIVKSPVGPTVLTFGSSGEHATVDDDAINVLGTRLPSKSLPFQEPHNLQNAAMALLLVYGYMRWRRVQTPDSVAGSLLDRAEKEAKAQREAKRTVYSQRRSSTEPFVMPAEVLTGLQDFTFLAHRMEPVGERNGIRIINNSMCTNVDAIIKSAMAIREPKHLLIGGVNKGVDFKPLKNYLANRQSKAYLFGRDAEQIDGMLGGEWPVFSTLEQAFSAAIKAAAKGEVVMLSPGCASFDQFKDFRDRGNVFKEIAKEWLNR